MGMTEIWMPSPNYSVGRGPYEKVVHHLTVGAQTIEALGNFFASSSAGVSSHFGADNVQAGVVGAYVYESNKAWTQGNANPYCLSMELCTPAGAENWSRDYWLTKQAVLIHNAADWTAWMCSKYGIPIVSLNPSQAQTVGIKGVCDHVDFGAWGGGHVDCGPNFPMDKVIEWAKTGAPTTPATEDDVTAAVKRWNGKNYAACIGVDNRVYVKEPDNATWYMVDENSNAKSGLGYDIDDKGNRVIIFTNQAGDVCTYEQTSGGGPWHWANLGGNAR